MTPTHPTSPMPASQKDASKAQSDACPTCSETCLSTYIDTHGPILSLDIGSGTQDVLLALPHTLPTNWPRFVLPSPEHTVRAHIKKATDKGAPIWLYGENMGGGFADAIKNHRAAGLNISTTATAATALHDDPERVKALGIAFSETCPQGYEPVQLGDFSKDFWNTLLLAAGLPLPRTILAAVQDHGVHAPHVGGNRIGRFLLWKDLLTQGNGAPSAGLFATELFGVPPQYTRLASLQAQTLGMVADTGIAALFGALACPEVAERSHRQGITIINIGNTHIVAFLVYQERIMGVYEHHTGQLDIAALQHDLMEFRHLWLPDELVRAAGGHGCAFKKDIPPESEGFNPTYILGPKRDLLRGQGTFIAPYGDMMCAGAHGLIHGLIRLQAPVYATKKAI